MPNIRINNSMSNVQAKNTLPALRFGYSAVNLNIKNDLPHLKILSGGSITTTTTPAVSFAGKGYLIGMLGLTYTKVQTTPQSSTSVVSDLRPHLRIQNG